MIDALLAEITSLGWLFNNCYQVDAHLWRVNLRKPIGSDGDFFTDWAEGETFIEALEDCMSKLASAEFFEAHAVNFAREIESRLSNKERLTLRSLGLRKPVKVERRA